MLAKTLLLSAAMAATAAGQATSLDLSRYHLTRTFALPAICNEASSITYNWDTGTLFTMGDNGTSIVELTRAGVPISAMYLSGFQDTEGLTYIGNGRFVLAEERIQSLYLFTYTAGATLPRAGLQHVVLGDFVDNIGIEGVSYEPRTGLYFCVKEKDPERVIQVNADFPGGTAVQTDMFNPALLGVVDLSDIKVLSTLPFLAGTPARDNLLIISQESQRVIETTRAGVVVSHLDMTSLSSIAEGITIDNQGTIFICDETPRVFVFEPAPGTPQGSTSEAAPAACYANCDGSTTPPVLNVSDFTCFLTAFAAGASHANCDGSTTPPVLNVNDFICFQGRFAAGCP